MSEHSRSIDLGHHSIRQDYFDDLMRTGGVSSKDNTADILTKYLQPELHTKHTTSLFPDRRDLMPGQQGHGSEPQESSSEPILSHTITKTRSLPSHIHTHVSPSPTHNHMAHHLSPSPESKNATTLSYARPANIGWHTSNNKNDHLFPSSNKKLPET
jgi:hypothetical protein